MLSALSLLCALAALAIVLGWPPLPTGSWPGITLGLFAVLAGVLARRSAPTTPAARWATWAGLAIGTGAAVLGVAVYVGLIVLASRLG